MLFESLEVLKRAIQAVAREARSRNGASNLGYLKPQSQHFLLSALVHSEPAISGCEYERGQANNPRTDCRNPISGRAGLIEYFETAWSKPTLSNYECRKKQYREPHGSRYGQPINDCSDRLIEHRKLFHVHPPPPVRVL